MVVRRQRVKLPSQTAVVTAAGILNVYDCEWSYVRLLVRDTARSGTDLSRLALLLIYTPTLVISTLNTAAEYFSEAYISSFKATQWDTSH